MNELKRILMEMSEWASATDLLLTDDSVIEKLLTESAQLKKQLEAANEVISCLRLGALKYYDDTYKDHQWECDVDEITSVPIDPEYHVWQELKKTREYQKEWEVK